MHSLRYFESFFIDGVISIVFGTVAGSVLTIFETEV